MPFCLYCDFQIPLAEARFCPNCGKAIEPGVLPKEEMRTVEPEQALYATSNVETPWKLLPGEQIEWEKDFKEGLIHRHVEKAYVITNHQVVAINTVNGTVAASLPLRETDLVVMDRHTSSTSTGAGTYHGGMGTSIRTGSSRSIGTLVFLLNGVERIRLGGIGDPDGVRNLFTSPKRLAPI